ncbi:MFS transporter [Klebsiella sp. RHBSTW-00484]|uniref:MFS transporter n=1 Tax=unclassified Klebsiella TaxID=2608929 RepID=UPI0015E5340C|nr:MULTISPECIES: MFS transporter [unclassified Klebsiella]MBA7844087.1 MFS transporter [Klebsiella sp. RHBSTW-00465]QLO39453.1 MFS transporter [Klebsiella sp. RHBSTW-00484]QLT78975.1 MFS transporter [Klebsiella sp. RHBSTW-00464]
MVDNPTKTSWLPLIVLCFAQFLASADNVTLSIATQALMSDLHATLGQISTANTMYPLIAGTFMVAGGMLGCIWGWRMLFRIGCLIFILAEVGAFFSPSITVFTWGARLTAGIGGSLMIPAVFGLISSLYQQRQRVTAFGALGASSGISFACGPILCGYLLDHVGWRVAFASLGLLALLILLCSTVIPSADKKRTSIPFDTPGFLLGTLGLFLTIFGILRIPVWGLIMPFDASVNVLGLSPAPFVTLSGLIVLLIMLRWERHFEAKTGYALLPSVFLKTRLVRHGLYLTGWIFFAYSSAIFTVVSFAQIVKNVSAMETGLLILPFAICLAACSLGLPLFIQQRNPRRQCQMGLIAGLSGALIAAVALHVTGFTPALMALGLCLIGAGMGTIAANAPILVTTGAGNHHAEQSGGVQAASRDIGQALGMALISTVMLTVLTFLMKYQVQHDLAISLPARQIVEHLNFIPWISDRAFHQFIQTQNLASGDLMNILSHYQQSRLQSTRYGLLAMAIVTLLLFIRLRDLPKSS